MCCSILQSLTIHIPLKVFRISIQVSQNNVTGNTFLITKTAMLKAHSFRHVKLFEIQSCTCAVNLFEPPHDKINK